MATKGKAPVVTKLPAPAKGKPPAPAPVDEGEDLYDDVVVGGDAEVEENYDDVVIGGGDGDTGEDLYDDVLATSTGAAPEENYEDMAPGENYEDMAPGENYEDVAPGGGADSYVTMEKKVSEEDEELYVDVDEPVHTTPDKLTPAKQPSKGGTLSKMFQKKHSVKTTGGGGALSGKLSYKAPKKSKFEEKWCSIEGNNLAIYKNSGDKRSQEKIPLSECRLERGSTEAGAGNFAFHLSKGDKVHHFSLKDGTDLEDWVSVLKGLVKYAEVGEMEVYQAREDHIGDGPGELTFKKGTYLRLLNKESGEIWFGQIGNQEQVFEGKKGKFPASKVQLAEDLYF